MAPIVSFFQKYRYSYKIRFQWLSIPTCAFLIFFSRIYNRCFYFLLHNGYSSCNDHITACIYWYCLCKWMPIPFSGIAHRSVNLCLFCDFFVCAFLRQRGDAFPEQSTEIYTINYNWFLRLLLFELKSMSSLFSFLHFPCHAFPPGDWGGRSRAWLCSVGTSSSLCRPTPFDMSCDPRRSHPARGHIDARLLLLQPIRFGFCL